MPMTQASSTNRLESGTSKSAFRESESRYIDHTDEFNWIFRRDWPAAECLSWPLAQWSSVSGTITLYFEGVAVYVYGLFDDSRNPIYTLGVDEDTPTRLGNIAPTSDARCDPLYSKAGMVWSKHRIIFNLTDERPDDVRDLSFQGFIVTVPDPEDGLTFNTTVPYSSDPGNGSTLSTTTLDSSDPGDGATSSTTVPSSKPTSPTPEPATTTSSTISTTSTTSSSSSNTTKNATKIPSIVGTIIFCLVVACCV
ncbi:hypothetical protein FRC14_006366 [Serendipita sp. 396]|nr:hypothetical protein FRC14_006366 [Serendipita sp. 396]KAG8779269.1 hypothetical protein FRC15_010270 [Serendipita sp. 397]KAG8796674.1 hypothetical protein FRC16_009589 [Serendipita sp. 398]KAG8821652.1 hypothetical protein FRC19_007488 [Serendipita sp. 401]KAG8865071.1 hypothetical protein FRC20_009923 [Serendipita sp. 405]